jgi:hypothetical protein
MNTRKAPGESEGRDWGNAKTNKQTKKSITIHQKLQKDIEQILLHCPQKESTLSILQLQTSNLQKCETLTLPCLSPLHLIVVTNS